MIKTNVYRLIELWKKSDIEVKVLIIFIQIFSIIIFTSYQEISNQLIVNRDGSIRDGCYSRSTPISAKSSDSLRCGLLKILSNRLGFWEQQLELARTEIAYYEKLPKYQEFWRDTLETSPKITKLKELKYSSIDDAYEQEMNSNASLRRRMLIMYENEKGTILQDLVPGSGKWTEEKSNIDRKFAYIDKSFEEREKIIINRYEYILDQKKRVREIELIIEKRIILMQKSSQAL